MNRVTIQRNVFINFNEKTETYGFRIYDDFECTYVNTMDKNNLKLEDIDFLKLILNSNFGESIDNMLTFGLEHGMYIDEQWYTKDELKKMVGNEKFYLDNVTE